MPNPGIYPVDYTTPVGRLRGLIGDVASKPLDPPVEGQQDYTLFSDAELEGFLSAGDDSEFRAAGYAYLSLASQAALESRSIKDFDLAVDTTKRSEGLRQIAQMWFDKADGEDAVSGEEAFEIVPTGLRHGGFIPEGTLPQWGRSYTWSRWR